MTCILKLFFFINLISVINCDRPCAARPVEGRSVICVCNATYCDEITRVVPRKGIYISYTSSEAGSRFQKNMGVLRSSYYKPRCCSTTTLMVNSKIKHQVIEGFGGSVSDAAGINWKSLPKAAQKFLINSYFSVKGLEYNMVRTPIGGSDFSTHAYAFNEKPENDYQLSNYTLAPEDYMYKIPMIRAINRVATSPVHIVASTWSPPVWMKTNHNFSGLSELKKEHYETYALYHYKFIEKYANEGISIWAITTTNEPIDGYFGLATFNTLGWSVENMADWIANNLGPTIRNSKFSHVKILVGDDQRFTLPFWFNVLIAKNPKALMYIDGIAVHYYTDKFVPASILDAVLMTSCGRFILSTEASEGTFPWQTEKVELGSWSRAISYITDILEDLNHNLVGWIDWNLCLNTNGGPNWDDNYVDSAVIVNASSAEFYKQPMFYAIGHFSKFIRRGSRRIEVKQMESLATSSIIHVGFLTPDSTVVIVLFNMGSGIKVNVVCGKQRAQLMLEANSITTVEFYCDI